MKKILFIGHDASRTGAPMVLLHLIRWMVKQGNLELRLILIKPGDMLDEFRGACTVYLWESRLPSEGLRKQVIRRITGSKQRNPQQEIEDEIKAFSPEIIYGNTVASHSLCAHFQNLVGGQLISHVHELSFSLHAYFEDEMRNSLLEKFSKFIAVSDANRIVLEREYNIPPDKIAVVNEFIDVHSFARPEVKPGTLKSDYGLEGYFIVGGSGMPGWRKGFDLFLETAANISAKKSNLKIAFVWVGKVGPLDKSTLKYQSERRGITIPVILTDQLKAPANAYQDFDLFYLSSREDPFPLVCLEAASLSKPVICFENSGGMPEFVQDDAGWILPYENTETVASTILKLAEHQDEVKTKGKRACAKVAGYDVNILAPKIAALIKGA